MITWNDKKLAIIKTLVEYGYTDEKQKHVFQKVDPNNPMNPMIPTVNLKVQNKPGELIPVYFVNTEDLDGSYTQDVNGQLGNVQQLIRTVINSLEDQAESEQPKPKDIIRTPPGPTEEPEKPKINVPVVKQQVDIDISGPDELTVDLIQTYINPDATITEAFQFLQLCKSQRLNPFVGEAHLIKYGGKRATFVVGKDAHLRRAEEQKSFDGFKAGIIVLNREDKYEEREGSFLYTDKEILVGGWAEVIRKDIQMHFMAKVSLEEYIGRKADGTTTKMWLNKPATMIRKVALVQALREAYVGVLEGMYDVCEINDIGDVEVVK